jgi:hypothetical protein
MIMTEVEINSEVPEVAPQIEAQVNDSNDAAQARQEADERNWKAMRIKNNELEKRLKQYEDMQMKLMEAQISNAKTAVKEVDEFDSIADDEFIPKGKVKGLVQKEAQRYAKEIARQEVESFHQKQQDNQFMDRLNRQYSDFNEIVNPETLSLLEEKEPELAKTIADLKDPYKIGMQTYKFIKAMNIHSSAPEARREKEIEKAIDKSNKSVPSPASFEKRPIAQAFKMTDAMKKELYREMTGYASFASSVPEMG